MSDLITARAGGECPGCGLNVLSHCREVSLFDGELHDHPKFLECTNCHNQYLKGAKYERVKLRNTRRRAQRR